MLDYIYDRTLGTYPRLLLGATTTRRDLTRTRATCRVGRVCGVSCRVSCCGYTVHSSQFRVWQQCAAECAVRGVGSRVTGVFIFIYYQR
jgi:hypothetical protein